MVQATDLQPFYQAVPISAAERLAGTVAHIYILWKTLRDYSLPKTTINGYLR